jgi:Rv0078B-related antitoxin
MSEILAAVDVLYLEGLALKREQLRRQNPGILEAEIEVLLAHWIQDRPFDSPGRIRVR